MTWLSMDLKNKTLLVIAPHPDDEVIGCAGLIQKIKKNNGKVYVIFLTIGKTKDFSKKGKSTIKERENEIKKASKLLHIDSYDIIFKGKHHLKLDTIGQMEIMQIIERRSRLSIEKIKPDIVCFPSLYSYNQDHKLASYSVHSSLRPAEKDGKHFVPFVLAYEMAADGWSMRQQIVPNFFIKLNNEEINIKLKAMNLYSSQMRPSPNLRSLEILESFAKIRGAYIGEAFAEGYILYRGMFY